VLKIGWVLRGWEAIATKRKQSQVRGSQILDVREEVRIWRGTSLVLYAPSDGGMQMRLQFGAEGNGARVNMRVGSVVQWPPSLYAAPSTLFTSS